MFQTLPIQRPAGEAGVASCPRGRDPGSAVPPGLLEPGMTWYDVLGALPGAEARKLEQKYQAKAALLRPELIAGAPPNVLTAVTRAQELLDTAWQVLGDPDGRKRYDEAAGLRRSGGGLGQPGTGPGGNAVGGLAAHRRARATEPSEQARRRPGCPRAVLSRGPGGGDPARASGQDRSADRVPDGGRRAGGRSRSPAAGEAAPGRQAHRAGLAPARPVALVGSGRSSPKAATPVAGSRPQPWA